MRFPSLVRRVAVAIGSLTLVTSPIAAQRSIAPSVTLPAPAGFTIRDDPDALVFSWLPVPGATAYQLDESTQPNGPWTPIVAQPFAGTKFMRSESQSSLAYYRVTAIHVSGTVGDASIVPFQHDRRLGPPGVSAAQTNLGLTISWIPAIDAVGHSLAGVQVATPMTSVTLAVAATATIHTQKIMAQAVFASGVLSNYSTTTFQTFTPTICWPPKGETSGGQGPVVSASAAGFTVSLTWQPVGQYVASRIERSLAGRDKWEFLACVAAGAANAFEDLSIALQPQTSYDYRVSTIDPGGVVASSVVTATTNALESVAVGAAVIPNNTSYLGVQLQWQAPNARVWCYVVTSSFGRRIFTNLSTIFVRAPSGAHTFTVTPANCDNFRQARSSAISATVP